MPKYAKGSVEMKQFMEMVRSKKKSGKGFLGDLIKSGVKMAKNEVINRVPLPSFVKDPLSNLADKGIDYGVGKTGLGVKKPRKKKGTALGLP
jgi:hypothetical protein